MRSQSLMALFCLMALIALGKSAMADDDPVISGNKLSAVIAQYKAVKTEDEKGINERSDLVQFIAKYESPKALAFLGTVLREDKSRLVKLNVTYALNSLGRKRKQSPRISSRS